MKRIDISVLDLRDRLVFKIDLQTHRGTEFGENGCEFVASDGFILRSRGVQFFGASCDRLDVLDGDRETGTAPTVTMDRDALDRLKARVRAAAREYNEHFAGKTEQPTSNPELRWERLT